MASPITLRLDNEIRRRVARIARQRRTSASHVLREAITTWLEREEGGESVYESIKDLIGIAHGGDPRRSEDGGRKVAEMLQARRKRS